MASIRQDRNVSPTSTPSHWIRLAAALVLHPCVLFLSSADLSWWQAWVFSVLFVSAGIGLRLRAERRHPGLMAERARLAKAPGVMPWDKLLAPLMGVSLGLPLVLVAGLDHRFGWSPPLSIWLNMVGLILVAAGYGFAGWALSENRFFSTFVRIQTERGHVVCDTGPYRIVRHPGYAGNTLPPFALVLALSSIWALIPAAVALIITVTRTAMEDKALQQELPGYRDYVRRVRYRLIPGVY